MPKKSKVVEYEIAMSDDEENIKVKMIDKKPPRKRVEQSQEAREAMLKRLEEGRKKAFEVRMKNKAEREKNKKEDEEKTEKVSSYLKNEDIFEKKYSSKFEKLEEMLSGLDNNFKEIKEYKKQKREKQMKEAEEKKAKIVESKPSEDVKQPETKLMTPTTSVIPTTSSTSTACVAPISKGLPNYRGMTFGRR